MFQLPPRLLLVFVAFAGVRADENFAPQYEKLAHAKGHDADRLHKLFDVDWKRTMQENPEFATEVGYPGFDDRWSDMSPEAIEQRKKNLQLPLGVTKTINRAKLSKPDQLNYDLFSQQLNLAIEGNEFPDELQPINQLGGVQQDPSKMFDLMPKTSVKHYENVLARLRGLPRLIEQTIALMKRGMAAKVTPPKITLRDVTTQISNAITPEPMDSSLLEVFKKFPADILPEEQERLRAEATTAYRDTVTPALEKLRDFFTNEYLPQTREDIGIGALPNGQKWYAYNVRVRTTTNMTPQEIHDLGLREVKRIRGEIDKVIASTGFTGSFDEFTKSLNTDPKFFYTNAADLVKGYRDIAKRIDPELPRLFKTLPRNTYGVRPVPPPAEKSQTAAYYQPGSLAVGRAGIFFANTYKLDSRPTWAMEDLTLHEAVPGHHFQISIAQELGEVPEFRKYSLYTAFVEGWGLYAETLGDELGLYADPYSKFGQLYGEMWRACRLVMDTGIHTLGWTRQQSIDYLKANAGKEDHDSTVETDRYIVWPGQALAYKIGQLKIREMREFATKELGDKFDVRTFHDAVLANAALPLDLLETKIKEWVIAQKAAH